MNSNRRFYGAIEPVVQIYPRGDKNESKATPFGHPNFPPGLWLCLKQPPYPENIQSKEWGPGYLGS